MQEDLQLEALKDMTGAQVKRLWIFMECIGLGRCIKNLIHSHCNLQAYNYVMDVMFEIDLSNLMEDSDSLDNLHYKYTRVSGRKSSVLPDHHST